MINEELIIESAFCVDGGEDSAKEARTRFKDQFPGRSSRRMTHLGMLVSLCMRELYTQEDVPVVYASAFAESCSLEHFIDSFPQASPMLFQTSIHPSAVEQALISKQNPVRRFYPITSERNLAGQALENAAVLCESRILLVGGEEKGEWLCPFNLASRESFAFGIGFSRGGEGIGRVRFERADSLDDAQHVELPQLWRAIRDRSDLNIPSFALRSWMHLEWR